MINFNFSIDPVTGNVSFEQTENNIQEDYHRLGLKVINAFKRPKAEVQTPTLSDITKMKTIAYNNLVSIAECLNEGVDSDEKWIIINRGKTFYSKKVEVPGPYIVFKTQGLANAAIRMSQGYLLNCLYNIE